MKEWDLISRLSVESAGGSPAVTAAELNFFYGGRYKFCALAAILLLAFCSMLAGAVTLKWSAGNVKISKDPLAADLDILDLEEREKLVRYMWDVYSNSKRIRLPHFWKDAFEAAFEELKCDDVKVHDAAVTDIARMSMSMVELDQSPRQTLNFETEIDRTEGDVTAKSNPFSSSSSSSLETR